MGKILFILAGVFSFCAANNATAQWRQFGPLGGDVTSFASSAGLLYAGTNRDYSNINEPQGYGGGVFRSTDGGLTWTQINSGLTDTEILALAAKGPVLFASTDSIGYYPWITLSSTSFRSTDGGASWSRMDGLPSNHFVYAFTFIGSDVFAGTDSGGVYRSRDNGVTWTPVNTGLTSIKTGAVAANVRGFASAGPYIFAGTQAGVFRSSDGGSTWIDVTQGAYTGINALAVLDTIVFANDVKSTNYGLNWVPIDSAKHAQSVSAYTVSNSGIVAATPIGVSLSTDQGISWSPIVDTFTVDALGSIGSDLFIGNHFGVFRSTDTVHSWSRQIAGMYMFYPSVWTFHSEAGYKWYGADTIYSIFKTKTLLLASSDFLLYISSDNGLSWYPDSSLPDRANAFAEMGDTVFAGTNDSGVYRSTDDGRTWTNLTGLTHAHRVTALAILASQLLAGTWDYGIFRSSDNGISWLPANTGLSGPGISALFVWDSILFAGGSALYRSTDTGNTWSIPDSISNYGADAFASAGPYIYALSNDIIRSSDGGLHWSSPDTGQQLTTGPLLAANDSLLFVAGGWSRSTYSWDGGASWSEEDWIAPQHGVYCLTIIGTNLLAGTGNGIFYRPLSNFPKPIQQPASVLSQANAPLVDLFPNPTSGPITVRGAVGDITITNVLGESVMRDASSVMREGNVELDLSKLPAGTYFARIETATGALMKKIVKE